MERRDQVLRLQAQLEAKRQELAQIQQRIHKAEVCRRSQASTEREGTQDVHVHGKQEANDESVSAGSSRSVDRASQGLVRSLMDPHSPLWLSGQHYPAQYLIRQTRSMSRAKRGIVIMPKPPPSGAMATVKDFDLPDDIFYQLKQQRLRESPPSCCRQITCKLVERDNAPIQLKCTRHIQCAPGEVSQSEKADRKLIVKGDGSFAVLFADSFAFCRGTSANHFYSHSLSKTITCFDWLTTDEGAVLVSIAHPGEIVLLVYTEGHLEHPSLSLTVPTDSVAWPMDFACHNLNMSELSTGSVLVTAYCCEEVCVWSVSMDPWQCKMATSFSVPRLSSLFLLNNLLLATTADHRLLIYSDCVSCGPPSSPGREVPLSCPSLDHNHSSLPLILAATYTNNCLLIVFTVEWSGQAHLSDASTASTAAAAWIVALRDGHNIPYLLHTYRSPHTTISLPLALHAYTPLNKPWTLVGVADGAHVIVWRGSGGALPSVTLTLEGESVSELAWDSLSNTCLVLDKFRQVHFFKNCTAQSHI